MMFFTERSTPGEKLSPRQAYDALAESYDHIPNPMIALERGAMGDLIPPLDGLTVADLGCGTGRYTARALQAGARAVYAVDLSVNMLRVTEGRVSPDPRVKLVHASMENIPLCDGAVDVILSGLALGYVTSLERAISEMARLLRVGGAAVLSDLHPVGTTLGWAREYRMGTNGSSRKIVVDYHPYTFERLFELFYDCGFALERVHEVPVGDAVGPFVRGLRERIRVNRLLSVPAVAVFLLRKETERSR